MRNELAYYWCKLLLASLSHDSQPRQTVIGLLVLLASLSHDSQADCHRSARRSTSFRRAQDRRLTLEILVYRSLIPSSSHDVVDHDVVDATVPVSTRDFQDEL
jgi:hypothetical protein